MNEIILPLEKQQEEQKINDNTTEKTPKPNVRIPIIPPSQDPDDAEDDFLVGELFETVGAIHLMKHRLDTEYYDSIRSIIQGALVHVVKCTGSFLHGLGNPHKPKPETLLEMITAVPSSLIVTNDDGKLPIYSALWGGINSLQYIPLLAREGVEYEVGGENGRGGLLVDTVINPGDFVESTCCERSSNSDSKNTTIRLNVLQCLTTLQNETMECDQVYLDTLTKLRQLNLFQKEDISNFQLLQLACQHSGSQLRFEYLFDWFWRPSDDWSLLWSSWSSVDDSFSPDNSIRRKSMSLSSSESFYNKSSVRKSISIS